MGRRDARQQETEDFLEQNPHLIEYQTRIEVKPVPEFEKSEPEQNINFLGPYEGQSFFAEVTPEGEMPYAAFTATVLDEPDVGTAAFFVEGQNFALFAGEKEIPEEFDGPMIPFGGLGLVTMSEDGFGVAGFSELFPEGPEMMMYGPPELPDGFDTINSNEFLMLEASGEGPLIGISSFEEGPHEGPLPWATGGTSLGIDFVGTGRGTVQIVLVDFDTDQEIIQEMFFRGGRLGKEGYFEADMPEGQFEIAAITTTGSLEISVVGIDLGTNFLGGNGFPFPDN